MNIFNFFFFKLTVSEHRIVVTYISNKNMVSLLSAEIGVYKTKRIALEKYRLVGNRLKILIIMRSRILYVIIYGNDQIRLGLCIIL